MKRLCSLCRPSGRGWLVACSGDTDPATNVTNVSAQLNAHGHTTGEPAMWWWEYDTVQSDLGTANDTEVCGVGTGRRRPTSVAARPARRTGGDVPLNVVVTGLTPNTTYYFRACGQDQSWSRAPAERLELQDAGRHQLRLRPQVGHPRHRQRPVLLPRRASPPTRPATSTSLTRATTASRSSARPGPSSPSGAPPARATGSSTSPSGVATDAGRQRLRRRRRQPPDPEVQLDRRLHHQVGGTRVGQRPVRHTRRRGDRLGAATSTSPTTPTTGSRSSARRATFITKWGSSGAGNGQFDAPCGVAIDAAGNVYVADLATTASRSSARPGTFITQWGTGGTGNGQF